MFVGQHSAEVFGDYGAGPNHVLPTSGTARYTGGLSVFTFLVSAVFSLSWCCSVTENFVALSFNFIHLSKTR